MFSVQKSPLKEKLMLVMMFTSLISIVLVCVGLFAYEYFTARQILIDDLSTKAEIIGANCTAALTFDNSSDANQTLSTLTSQPRIMVAAVFTKQGTLFASYLRTDLQQMLPQAAKADGYYFEEGRLELFQPIKLNNARIGTMFLSSDLETLYARFRSYGQIVLLVLIGSLTVAYLAASALQNRISRPILELVETTKQISERQDYSLRAQKKTEDEFGSLAETFNTMLSRIQERDADLKQTNESMAAEIFERKRAEEKLQKTLLELERSNRELEQFAYVASHDLQEPLRMVSSFTQLLEHRYGDKLDTDAKEFIAFAVDGANRMQGLINDLLAYSRVGTRGKKFEPTDVHSVLGEAIINLSVAIEESRGIITNDDLPTVMADVTQLGQLFQNLVGNAIKFRNKESPRVHVSARETLHEWTFSVQDNGIGITPEYFERIFVVFQRLHGKEAYPGTGIGLAICKRIVERHSGRIWLESEPGKGSTFYFTIPKMKGEKRV